MIFKSVMFWLRLEQVIIMFVNTISGNIVCEGSLGNLDKYHQDIF